MYLHLLSQINLVAVLISAIVYFMIGSLWYSFLVRDAWVAELKEHDVTIKQHAKEVLRTKMLLTFCANVLASIAMALLVIMAGSTTVYSGFCLGLLCVLGFAATTLGTVFIWEHRSFRLFLLDIGYPAIGLIVAAIILSIWQ